MTYAFFSGKSKSLKAGEYFFLKNSSNKVVLQKLYLNEVKLYKFTIPECYSNKQIFSKLKKHFPLFKGDENFSEGDFFPSTYHFSKDTKVLTLLNMIRNEANNKFTELYTDYKDNIADILKSKKEVLILASIIEAESKLEKDKRKIAAVFFNRLKLGMKLQSDPTVIYGINKAVYETKILNKKDLLINHKWNTYKINGLPPTPICSVGIDAFYAALNPQKNDNLYFVADGKGGHIFSKSYKEHMNNIKIIYKK